MLQEQSSWRGGNALRATTTRDGSFIALTARRAYDFARVRPAPVDALPTPSWESVVSCEADYHAAFRHGTDIVTSGSAFAARPSTHVDTSVTVGPLGACVRVWGKRKLDRMAGGYAFTDAEPFVQRDLGWSAAYGGAAPAPASHAPQPSWRSSEAAESIDLDLRNPYGRGYLGEAGLAPALGLEMPSQEDPRAPLSPTTLLRSESWLSAPSPVGFGPLTIAMYPRVSSWLPLVPQPTTPADPYRCGAYGLGGTQLAGGEPIELLNMHPDRPVQRTTLPRDVPIAELRLAGCALRRLPLVLKTVFLEPARSLMFLTWSAAVKTLVLFDEVALDEASMTLEWREL